MPIHPIDQGIIDTIGPVRNITQYDARLDLRLPEQLAEEKNPIDYGGRGLWNLFSRCKYWSATHGPRKPGKRPEELTRAAELLRDALTLTWRAGYKGEDVADLLLNLLGNKTARESNREKVEMLKICPTCGASVESRVGDH